ncbi:hypothetical protein HYV82_03945 [Candidatus Woesearchaeota archaeon]|nr:hypothetical protein [Candidatus Woesearchaeota archaeon]
MTHEKWVSCGYCGATVREAVNFGTLESECWVEDDGEVHSCVGRAYDWFEGLSEEDRDSFYGTVLVAAYRRFHRLIKDSYSGLGLDEQAKRLKSDVVTGVLRVGDVVTVGGYELEVIGRRKNN